MLQSHRGKSSQVSDGVGVVMLMNKVVAMQKGAQ